MRKEIKVRQGYIPLDEQARYTTQVALARGPPWHTHTHTHTQRVFCLTQDCGAPGKQPCKALRRAHATSRACQGCQAWTILNWTASRLLQPVHSRGALPAEDGQRRLRMSHQLPQMQQLLLHSLQCQQQH